MTLIIQLRKGTPLYSSPVFHLLVQPTAIHSPYHLNPGATATINIDHSFHNLKNLLYPALSTIIPILYTIKLRPSA